MSVQAPFLQLHCPLQSLSADVIHKLHLRCQYLLSPGFHVSVLKPTVSGPLDETSPTETPPPTLDSGGSPAHTVMAILDSCHPRVTNETYSQF